MVKKIQSRALDVRNKEYRDFIRAVKEGDNEGIVKGQKKGFFLANRLFIELLTKEINAILNRQYNYTKTYGLIRLLDPENINVVENGYTLLDHIIDLFGMALEQEDEPSAKKYFINHFTAQFDKLLSLGAEINQIPKLYANEEFIQKLEELETDM
jgi:hypothetical protein